MLRPFFLVTVVLGLAMVSSACSSEESRKVDLNLGAISGLASAAAQDAESMEIHAEAMATAARGRPDEARWLNAAETFRGYARTLRFLSDSALAIRRDQEVFPATESAVDLDRLLGNGLNLQYLGETLLAHAEAMEGHIQLMRLDAAGQPQLTASIDALEADAARLRNSGQAALEEGAALAEEARKIARSLGEEIE